ncbi:MAG: Na+/H+ antiporter NhaC family protein [Lutibacter sp.]|uniref:Na+/H+ antiporter NhaC family protein n=1 Tax=Lutibacter sp. TaxID=1925666 RepID=UPI00299EB425|nr:Na+/H+ antiporter NhaC family protein [Lutibacter sp.]MDX1828813.1 Na+/H+ antiporter NhaC family protein [Lutibacter sp.]
MPKNDNLTQFKAGDITIVENKDLNIWKALLPVFVLVALLAFNVFVYGDDALSGSNQFILLMGAAVAAMVGFTNKVSYKLMIEEVAENVKSTTGAILILLMVGALAGTWLISGVIPSMIYYGLQILSPTIFLAASLIICIIVSTATGSSWTTSATMGIALMGIGSALGVPPGMTAGAVLSGAYFGDKMSPLSDTTNLAPAMAGGDIFEHIKYMTITTVPTITITLIVFIILGFTIDTVGTANTQVMLTGIKASFHVTPLLFIVPLVVIVLIVKKTSPLIALIIGTLLGGLFAIIFQSAIIWNQGLRYQVTKVPEKYSKMVTWDNITNNHYQTPGTYKLVTKADNITLQNPVLFTLPESNKKVSQIFKGSTTILEDGKVVGELKVTAKPTSFFTTAYFAVMNAMTVPTSINTKSKKLNDLFSSKGMGGMLGTIWLILCAMTFGGVMDAIGALAKISSAILNLFDSIFGLFASTVFSCIALNVTASDQYLAIVVPGKMYAKAFKDKGLAPENLSRTLEDAGTVTSTLVPWNTGGAYQSGVLGVSVHEYFIYAIFNWLSPIMTLIFAAFKIKIKKLVVK